MHLLAFLRIKGWRGERAESGPASVLELKGDKILTPYYPIMVDLKASLLIHSLMEQ
jgi:hypothetical protein